MNRVLTVGVVGLGYWGPNLARNFNQLLWTVAKRPHSKDSETFATSSMPGVMLA
jgi:hypothetical protein